MSTQVTNYQCPNCTGPLHFVGESGKLECDYCGSSYEVSEIEALFAEKEQAAEAAALEAEKQPPTDEDTWGLEEGMKAYNCPSCGAQLICDQSTAATSCPYCGNPTVVPGQFAGSRKPDCIIPFKLSQEEAVNALRNYYKGKLALPSAFSQENHIQELKGIYVPFWLFNGKAQVDLTVQGQNSFTSRQGDYRVTRVDTFDVRRSGVVEFQKVPVDASVEMPDALMDSIEPYDYNGLTDFSTAYLPGYLANRYNVSQKECETRAAARTTETAINSVLADVTQYSSRTLLNHNIDLKFDQISYALLPVYTLHTKWNNKDYLFAMNGQTGKMIGDLPIDKKKLFGLAAGIAAVITAIASFILL